MNKFPISKDMNYEKHKNHMQDMMVDQLMPDEEADNLNNMDDYMMSSLQKHELSPTLHHNENEDYDDGMGVGSDSLSLEDSSLLGNPIGAAIQE